MAPLKEVNEIMEFLDSGDVERFYFNDTLIFKCQRCLLCCKNMDVLLNLFDIARLRDHLKIDKKMFLEKYCIKYKRIECSQLPGIMLNHESKTGCFFQQDNRCGVYNDKPSWYRYYPLMKIIQISPDRKRLELLGLSTDDYFFNKFTFLTTQYNFII